MSTVIPFRKPPDQPEDPLLYVTIFPNSTIFNDPTRDEVDRRAAVDAMFNSMFYVCKDTDNCVMLVMLGAERMDSVRSEHTFETRAQRAWLRRRLDALYEQVTGEHRGIFSHFRAFIRRVFNPHKDQAK